MRWAVLHGVCVHFISESRNFNGPVCAIHLRIGTMYMCTCKIFQNVTMAYIHITWLTCILRAISVRRIWRISLFIPRSFRIHMGNSRHTSTSNLCTYVLLWAWSICHRRGRASFAPLLFTTFLLFSSSTSFFVSLLYFHLHCPLKYWWTTRKRARTRDWKRKMGKSPTKPWMETFLPITHFGTYEHVELYSQC